MQLVLHYENYPAHITPHAAHHARPGRRFASGEKPEEELHRRDVENAKLRRELDELKRLVNQLGQDQ